MSQAIFYNKRVLSFHFILKKEKKNAHKRWAAWDNLVWGNAIFTVLPAMPTYVFQPVVHLVKTTDCQLLNAVSNCG